MNMVERRAPIFISLDRLDGIEGVRILSQQSRNWMQQDPKKRTIAKLAKRAALNPRTVARIINRDTVQPRFYTLTAILKALGFVAARFD